MMMKTLLVLATVVGLLFGAENVMAQKKGAAKAASVAKSVRQNIDWVAFQTSLASNIVLMREVCCGCEAAKLADLLVGSSGVDALINKACDLASTDIAITREIEFIKIDVVDVPDDGSGVTKEVRITNGKGEAVTTENALKQLLALATKITQLVADANNIASLTSAAVSDIESASFFKKASYISAVDGAKKTITSVVEETGKQADKVNGQIAALKMLKSY